MKQKKPHTIKQNILIPTILLILLLLFICIVFCLFVFQYGYYDALDDLQSANAGVAAADPLLPVVGWIRQVICIVLILSLVICLIVLIQLRSSVKKIVDPLEQLYLKADKCNFKHFDSIEPEFDLKELEDLRVAFNSVASKLNLKHERQKEVLLNASHKIQSRVMHISGYAQGLEQGIYSLNTAGTSIRREAEALTTDIKQIISLATLDSYSAPAKQEPVPITDILENCIDRYSYPGTQKGISIVLQKNPGTIYVLGTEDNLEEILDNLLSNAVRYAKEKILISIQKENDQVLLTVRDDGSGINEKDLPHIFERFYKGKDGNFGLGLTIARSAAEHMGGTLTASNDPDGGAVFTLVLKSAEPYKDS